MIARHRMGREEKSRKLFLHVLNGILVVSFRRSSRLSSRHSQTAIKFIGFLLERRKACEGIAENKLFYRKRKKRKKNSSKSSKGEERKIASRSL